MSAKAILSAAVSVAPVYIEDVFSTFLYTGNGATQTITNGIDLSGKGGLTWIKARNDGGASNQLFDTVRGAGTKVSSNQTNQAFSTVPYGLTAFGATGFTVADDSIGGNAVNGPPGGTYSGNGTYCSWTFRKQPKFFDVVTYTGTGSNTTIAHNLGSVPGSIIVKRTDTTAAWAVYHRSLANTQYLVLNTTAAVATGATWWNSTTPTSSVFSVGTDASVNASGGTYVAYLFAHDAGGFGTAGTDNVVSCGGFTADGSGAATVSIGYEPQWILVKRTSSATDWHIYDTMRGWTLNSSGVGQQVLYPNLSSVEGAGYPYSVNATGFGLTGVGAGNTFIYIAIRRGPMKTPTVGTSVFSASTSTQSSSALVTSGFPVDTYITGTRTNSPAGYGWPFFDRLRGGYYLKSASTAAETTLGGTGGFDYNTGVAPGMFSSSPITLMFRRAPGFFDVVAYTGNGSTGTRLISHNLGTRPEFVVLKRRDTTSDWLVANDPGGLGILNNSNSYFEATNNFNGELVTTAYYANATTFTVTGLYSNNVSAVNASGGNYIAYLFATLAGVSKVGTYTGTGTTKQIDCGFTAGARFVMIKRTDSTGDWYVWDTARGIISGNDPYLLLNSTAAEVTGTDYIDPLSSGFEISSTAPAAINANGGNFIFLSIA